MSRRLVGQPRQESSQLSLSYCFIFPLRSRPHLQIFGDWFGEWLLEGLIGGGLIDDLPDLDIDHLDGREFGCYISLQLVNFVNFGHFSLGAFIDLVTDAQRLTFHLTHIGLGISTLILLIHCG